MAEESTYKVPEYIAFDDALEEMIGGLLSMQVVNLKEFMSLRGVKMTNRPKQLSGFVKLISEWTLMKKIYSEQYIRIGGVWK